MAAPVRDPIEEFRDAELVCALKSGDERAFLRLVDALHPGMVRFARAWAGSAAEDVVQDAWEAVLGGLHGFEGRSSLRSWIFGIVANLARSRAAKDRRAIPLSSLISAEGPAEDPGSFLPESHPRWAGHWAKWPEPWPDQQLLDKETLERIGAAIQALPDAQRAVIQLRDVEGWTSEEVCDALGLSEGNQRVILHRARSRVRAALARFFEEGSR